MKQGNERKMMNKEICTDIDGNVYETVLIGDQCWMLENLKTTHYRDGTPIPNVTESTTWVALSTGAYCEYGNNLSNVSTYGRMYNWYAVDDAHGLAPDGWHMPTDEEIKQLEMHLGMSEALADSRGGYRGTNEGSKLSGRADLWRDYGGALETDPEFGTSGFMALPGGMRRPGGSFDGMTYNAFFWSSPEDSSTDAWGCGLGYDHSAMYRISHHKRSGFSVRCVKIMKQVIRGK